MNLRYEVFDKKRKEKRNLHKKLRRLVEKMKNYQTYEHLKCQHLQNMNKSIYLIKGKQHLKIFNGKNFVSEQFEF